jgi:hypothetical protein
VADTPLDTLYRARTSEGLEESLPGSFDLVEGSDIPERVQVDVRWPHKQESHLRMICTRDTVIFARLDSHRAGLYGDLVEKLPRFFKLRGVERFVMTPEDDESKDILLKRGNWQPGPRGFEWVL